MEVGHIDFLRDSAILKLYYEPVSEKSIRLIRLSEYHVKMNKWQSAGVIIVFLCMGMGKLCAQSDDLGLWVSAEVKKKIFPGLDAFLEGEFRLRDNLRAVDRWGGTAGLSYRLFPFF